MKSISLAALLICMGSSVIAGEKRQLGSHEHGVGALDIAVAGKKISMTLNVPGADIVGFEHHAETAEDRAAIDDAVAKLTNMLSLYKFPDAAECSVDLSKARLIEEEAHEEEHEHKDEHKDEHAHKDDHGHEDEHGHENEAHEKEHDDHHDEEHSGGHSEFRAQYELTCANISGINQIEFPYFEAFPNAKELEIQMISGNGAQRFEVEKSSPVLVFDQAL